MKMHANAHTAIDGSIVLRETPLSDSAPEPDALTLLDGEPLYRINRYDAMPAFLMSLVSDGDLWMYVSSYGALTAGRVDEERCLFPYVTDDQLFRSTGQAGPVTTLRVRRGGEVYLWEPFTRFPAPDGIERNAYKSFLSNHIAFEEINHRLGLTFRYGWRPSDRYGFVRTATLESFAGEAGTEVDLLDGLVNILPSGVTLGLQQRYGCLVDAYTRCEIDSESGIGIFGLQSQIVDRAEPAESLIASVVWCRGIENPVTLLSTDQRPDFIAGRPIKPQPLLTGRRGAFLISTTWTLDPGQSTSWDIVADVGLDQVSVETLRSMLLSDPDPRGRVRESVLASRDALARTVAAADGQEAAADTRAVAHQAACVLFNVMRGGIFARNYQVPAADFRQFVAQRNKRVARESAVFLAELPESISYGELMDASARQPGGSDLMRLTCEYLPLTFSRRHGDPSRPWNRFAIRVKNPDGSQILSYQGNWRDIFQNWESLCLSYPDFLESIIAKFVNASTIDGFNPYRVMREGIEWEAPDADDPWATIGYWGDHQVIYLLKFLEASRNYHPGLIDRWLTERHFSYANVPYRIKRYEEILRDVRNTIIFDHELDARVKEHVREVGADGKLLEGPGGTVYHVTLTEKLLVTALAKLSNLVLDGGIWMNTQRPEWNDANNALVGNGISMVTLCYLRRYMAFCAEIFGQHAGSEVSLSTEVAAWLDNVCAILTENRGTLHREVTGVDRCRILDALGQAFSVYRGHVYRAGFTGAVTRTLGSCRVLCDISLEYLDHSIRANKRDDGLYHAYNLLERDGAEVRIRRLYEMLEGQVAVLSAGVLSAEESGTLVTSVFESALYRPDQNSFLLYPARRLPGFLQKNIVPGDRVLANPLLVALLESGDNSIIVRDVAGHYRFGAAFRNSGPLETALDTLAHRNARWHDLVSKHGHGVRNLFESVFDHHAFTGRSGGMYGYEGLGCIYWHMVSKFMVAVQETFLRTADSASPPAVRTLADEYYRVRAGMGFNKSGHDYGAFPADPYSHTPAHAGARQPGMTGQSKEDILARWGELGIFVRAGALTFHPSLLRRSEFLAAPHTWEIFDVNGHPATIELPAGAIAFTVCETPVVYRLSSDARIVVQRTDGTRTEIAGERLDPDISAEIFARSGSIARIDVNVPESLISLD
ncbi:MAG: hypothetical protein ACLQVD_09125 [Capsulimonadaceae bacterium]